MSRLEFGQLHDPEAQKEVMSSWEHTLAIMHVEWLPELASGCYLFGTHGHITMIVWEAATALLVCLMVLCAV